MDDPTEQLKIIGSVKDLLNRLGKDASPAGHIIIGEILGKLTELEYSLMR